MASFLAHSFARQTVWLDEPAIRSLEELLEIKEALDEFGDDIVMNVTSQRQDSISVLSDDVTSSNSNPSSTSGGVACKEEEDDHKTADTYLQESDNDLTCKDLYSVFQTVGTSKSIQRCQEMLDKCTIRGYNNNGGSSSRGAGPIKANLDFPTLIQTLLEEMQETITYDDLRKAFDIMDTDKDGKISVKNMSQISSGFGEEQISEQELEAMIKAVDREGTGLVTFEQFSSIINPPNEISSAEKQ